VGTLLDFGKTESRFFAVLDEIKLPSTGARKCPPQLKHSSASVDWPSMVSISIECISVEQCGQVIIHSNKAGTIC